MINVNSLTIYSPKIILDNIEICTFDDKKYVNDVRLEDLKGAELTRYPPGVQKSLLALKGLGTEIEDAPKSTVHLWLMNSKGSNAADTHPPTEERVSAMEEL